MTPYTGHSGRRESCAAAGCERTATFAASCRYDTPDGRRLREVTDVCSWGCLAAWAQQRAEQARSSALVAYPTNQQGGGNEPMPARGRNVETGTPPAGTVEWCSHCGAWLHDTQSRVTFRRRGGNGWFRVCAPCLDAAHALLSTFRQQRLTAS